MFILYLVGFVSLMLSPSIGGVAKDTKDSKPTEVVIHATNRTSVPTVHYLVDAVECLKEAYSVFADDASRAKLYAELFQEKHPETEWNVVIGYTASSIKSTWYVETSVEGGGKNKDFKDKDPKSDKDKGSLFLIFSRD